MNFLRSSVGTALCPGLTAVTSAPTAIVSKLVPSSSNPLLPITRRTGRGSLLGSGFVHRTWALLALVTTVLVSSWSTTAHAQTVLASNLSGTPNGNFQPSSTANWIAQSFQTTATLNTISSLTINLLINSAGTFDVRIFTNGSSVPGADTGMTFSSPTASTSFADTVFNVTGGGTLTANTTYWFVIREDTPNVIVNRMLGSSGTGSGYLASTAQVTSNSGSSWGANSFSMLFSISAVTPVPEPATYAALAGLAALGLAWTKRRHRTMA